MRHQANFNESIYKLHSAIYITQTVIRSWPNLIQNQLEYSKYTSFTEIIFSQLETVRNKITISETCGFKNLSIFGKLCVQSGSCNFLILMYLLIPTYYFFYFKRRNVLPAWWTITNRTVMRIRADVLEALINKSIIYTNPNYCLHS